MTRTAHRSSVNIVRPRTDVAFVTVSRFDRAGWQAIAAIGALTSLVSGWFAVWIALPH